MVVGEIPEFFQFPKCDISTARCKCTINIFTYKGIKVVIISEFINMTVLLSMWAVFIPIVFFTWSWIQFLKEIVLVMRNCYITTSEIELVFRRAELRCSRSLYSMLLFENCIWFKFSINIFWIKRMIHVSLWIRIYPLELNYVFKGVKDVMNTQWYNSYRRAVIWYLIYACALLNKCELKKAVHRPISLSAFWAGTVTKASSATDQRMYHTITKYIHAPWNYEMNLRVSLGFLFCFVFI